MPSVGIAAPGFMSRAFLSQSAQVPRVVREEARGDRRPRADVREVRPDRRRPLRDCPRIAWQPMHALRRERLGAALRVALNASGNVSPPGPACSASRIRAATPSGMCSQLAAA